MSGRFAVGFRIEWTCGGRVGWDTRPGIDSIRGSFHYQCGGGDLARVVVTVVVVKLRPLSLSLLMNPQINLKQKRYQYHG